MTSTFLFFLKINHVLKKSYECTHPVWSCVYDADDPLCFYAGLGNGQVLKFDKRTTDGFVQSLTTEGTNTSGPVYSLQYIAKNENNSNW